MKGTVIDATVLKTVSIFAALLHTLFRSSFLQWLAG